MYDVLFLDIEASYESKIQEIGLVFNEKTLKTSSIEKAKEFIDTYKPKYVVGHNFIQFDKKILAQSSLKESIDKLVAIDTLPTSLLLFNEKTFHNLPKKYKSEDHFLNDPVTDSELTRTLFIKVIEKFKTIPKKQQLIFYTLLSGEELFKGFFEYLSLSLSLEILMPTILEKSIIKLYESVIINSDSVAETINDNNIELAYILALLTPVTEIKAHPPKILFDYPEIIDIQKKLCFDLENSKDTLSSFAEDTFGFGSFRSFKRLEQQSLFSYDELSQREIIEASLKDESFLAVLPTGGGKTFTFWLPSLIKAKAYKSLTVVISPLQALIKDHIESFQRQVANFKAVAISGFLTPLERADAIDKVINGDADILYLAPESLRSEAIFKMLKNRAIERFVIDEAHCLSTWGNDFRHDYFYIGEFIRDLLEAKSYQSHIPISCFTATAKPNVIGDIAKYIKKSIDIELGYYLALPQRENLRYEAISTKDKKEKYVNLLKLVQEREGAVLIYIPSSTKTCDEIAQQLAIDTGKSIKSFHSKLEMDVKMEILDKYINNEIDIVIATTAFGMGVDKPNIMNVIHYEASDSLENYAQEAGRGARDQSLIAQCPLLFDENDLDKHFTTLNRTKTSSDEINAVFRVIKSSNQNPILKTSREIAKLAHWDVEDNSNEYDSKVKTSLLELEREGYLERKRNHVRYFGDSIAQDAMEKLHGELAKNKFDEATKQRLVLVLQTILGRGKPQAVQVDELALLLGYSKSEVSEAMLLLKELHIISESKDMALWISRDSISKYNTLLKIERELFLFLRDNLNDQVLIRELNQHLVDKRIINPEANMSSQIKEALKVWRAKEVFQFNRINRSKDIWRFGISNLEALQSFNKEKHSLSRKIIDYFTKDLDKKTTVKKFEIEFSIMQLKKDIAYEGSTKTLEKTLLYLHDMKLLELAQGRFIYYAPMSLYKTAKVGQKIKYTKDEYKKRMSKHYRQKVESIHIMGEYAKRLLINKKEALEFMKDYFILEFDDFKKKYKLSRKISQPLTQKKFEQIYNNLSDEQQAIMQDKTSKGIMILAGPGSGKTKVLVHKIAALILNEDVKPEQFLMLTYSRAAMMEFKQRLFKLIGAMALEVDIATFHGYALQLIAKQVTENDQNTLNTAIIQATKQIINQELELPFKTVLVIDEYQDINQDGFEFVKSIYESLAQDLRMIAVGDDDQCIMEHTNGANVEYIDKFKELFEEEEYATYELLNNFRSDKNIVEYSQNYIANVSRRYKTKPLLSNSKYNGYIEFIQVQSRHLIEPTINIINKNNLEGTTIFLAHTNNEVVSLYSHLKALNYDVKYLLDNESYKLKNLLEIYKFNELLQLEDNITEDILYKILTQLQKSYKSSKNFYKIQKLVKIFIENNEYLTFSIWAEFLDELDVSMFDEKAKYTISTIHKSKGKEFDNVIMMLQNVKRNDYYRRLYYVGMTRAKHNLYLLSNDNQFVNNDKNNIVVREDTQQYSEPRLLTYLIDLKSINLGLQIDDNDELIAGSTIYIKPSSYGKPRLLYFNGKRIGQLSKKFEAELLQKENIGYSITEIEIEAVVNWYNRKNSTTAFYPICKFLLEKSQ
jgi:ATP-dependent DNA helicase RecQ